MQTGGFRRPYRILSIDPEQRLEWLCQAATFVYEFKGKANSESELDLPSVCSKIRGRSSGDAQISLQLCSIFLSGVHIARSLFISFFAFLAATVFADTSPVKTESQRNRTSTPAVLQSPAAKQGLNFVVGAHGLDSLSFNGQSLLVSPESGELQPQKSVFRAVLDALLPRSSSPVATPNKKTDTVDLSYPWGRISCAYGKQDDRLTMRIEVSNTSSEPLNEFSLRLMELNFPSIPHGGTLEAGMFGFGFKGPEWRLHEGPPSIPSVADPRFVVPIIQMDYGTGALNFCSDDVECAVDVPQSTNFPARTSYPFIDHVPRYQAGRYQDIQRFAAFRPGRCSGCKISRATFWNGTQRSIHSR